MNVWVLMDESDKGSELVGVVNHIAAAGEVSQKHRGCGPGGGAIFAYPVTVDDPNGVRHDLGSLIRRYGPAVSGSRDTDAGAPGR